MAGTKLKIEGEGHVPSKGKYRIWLGDHEMTDITRELSLSMSVNDANIATFTVYVDEIELSADVEPKLIRAGGKERTSFGSRFREWLR